MTPRQKKDLRARAHALNPVVLTGQAGLSEAVLGEIDGALEHHELIKVRLRAERAERRLMAEEVCTRLGAEQVQAIGQIVTLYRKRRAV